MDKELTAENLQFSSSLTIAILQIHSSLSIFIDHMIYLKTELFFLTSKGISTCFLHQLLEYTHKVNRRCQKS